MILIHSVVFDYQEMAIIKNFMLALEHINSNVDAEDSDEIDVFEQPKIEVEHSDASVQKSHKLDTKANGS